MIRLHPNPRRGWLTFTIGWNKTCTVLRCLLKSGHITLGALLTLSLLPLLSSYLVSMWMENLGRKEHWEDRGHDSERWKITQKVSFFLHFTMSPSWRGTEQLTKYQHAVTSPISFYEILPEMCWALLPQFEGKLPEGSFSDITTGTDTQTDWTNAPS